MAVVEVEGVDVEGLLLTLFSNLWVNHHIQDIHGLQIMSYIGLKSIATVGQGVL